MVDIGEAWSKDFHYALSKEKKKQWGLFLHDHEHMTRGNCEEVYTAREGPVCAICLEIT